MINSLPSFITNLLRLLFESLISAVVFNFVSELFHKRHLKTDNESDHE